MEFRKGTNISLEGGKTAQVIDKIGEGGQGIVYSVKLMARIMHSSGIPSSSRIKRDSGIIFRKILKTVLLTASFSGLCI